jgi:hypothetical protein
MVVVVAEMLSYKFIQNLQMYDVRLTTGLRNMLISDRMHAEPVKINNRFNYSIDGIIDMVEICSSKSISKTELFIRKLKKLGIYTRVEYHKLITEYSEEFPECPEIYYDGFTWLKLIKSSKPYTIEECEARIIELCKTEINNIKKIKIQIDKLIYLHRIDNRIDVSEFETLKNRHLIREALGLNTGRLAIK